MIRLIGELMGAAVRLTLVLVKAVVEFAAEYPVPALVIAGIVVFLVLASTVHYFWLLVVGLLLLGGGARLREQGL